MLQPIPRPLHLQRDTTLLFQPDCCIQESFPLLPMDGFHLLLCPFVLSSWQALPIFARVKCCVAHVKASFFYDKTGRFPFCHCSSGPSEMSKGLSLGAPVPWVGTETADRGDTLTLDQLLYRKLPCAWCPSTGAPPGTSQVGVLGGMAREPKPANLPEQGASMQHQGDVPAVHSIRDLRPVSRGRCLSSQWKREMSF